MSALGKASHPLLLVIMTSCVCMGDDVDVELLQLHAHGFNVGLGHRSGVGESLDLRSALAEMLRSNMKVHQQSPMYLL